MVNFRRKLFWYIEHTMKTDSEKDSRAERESEREREYHNHFSVSVAKIDAEL